MVDEPFSVVSSSLDRSVRIFAIAEESESSPRSSRQAAVSGMLLGVLGTSDEEREAIASGTRLPTPWAFDCTPAKLKTERDRSKQASYVEQRLEELERSDSGGEDKLQQTSDLGSKLSVGAKQKQLFAVGRIAGQLAVERAAAEGAHKPLAEKRAAQARQALKSQLLSQLSKAPLGVVANNVDKAKGPEPCASVEKGTLSSVSPAVRLSEVSADKTYSNLDAETSRHLPGKSRERGRHLDALPSQFLSSQLRLSAGSLLRDKKKKRITALSNFKHRFVPGGYLDASESTQLVAPALSQGAGTRTSQTSNQLDEGRSGGGDDDNDRGTSAPAALQGEVGDAVRPGVRNDSSAQAELGVPRPKTAPHGLAGENITSWEDRHLGVFEKWERSNKSLLFDVSGVLSSSISLGRSFSLPRLASGRRPGTAAALTANLAEPLAPFANHEGGASQGEAAEEARRSWRRRSVALVTKYHQLAADLEQSSEDEAAPPQNAGHVQRKQRKSLVQRQMDMSPAAGTAHKRNANARTPGAPRRSSAAQIERLAAVSEQRQKPGNSFGRRFNLYSERSVRTLYDLFCAMDTTKSGVISMQQFMDSPIWNRSAIGITLYSMFESLDLNQDNAIDLSEFFRAFCPMATDADVKAMVAFIDNDFNSLSKFSSNDANGCGKKGLDEKAISEIHQLFDMLDTDKSGTISFEELKSVAMGSDNFDEFDRKIFSKFTSDMEFTREGFLALLSDYFAADFTGSSKTVSSQLRKVMSYNSGDKYSTLDKSSRGSLPSERERTGSFRSKES